MEPYRATRIEHEYEGGFTQHLAACDVQRAVVAVHAIAWRWDRAPSTSRVELGQELFEQAPAAGRSLWLEHAFVYALSADEANEGAAGRGLVRHRSRVRKPCSGRATMSPRVQINRDCTSLYGGGPEAREWAARQLNPVSSTYGGRRATPLTADLPVGTATFMLTDIVGSTRLWQRYPEGMRASAVRHDVLIEAMVQEHNGILVRPRGEGDSRFAVFSRASDAVAAACGAQRALCSEVWAVPEPLRVRIALHTGEADLRDGDYYGTPVNRCAMRRPAVKSCCQTSPRAWRTSICPSV